MTKKRLPLDPFDPKTAFNKDYQLGNLAWAIFLMGLLGGAFLIASSDFAGFRGWLTIGAGIVVIVGTAYIAHQIIK